MKKIITIVTILGILFLGLTLINTNNKNTTFFECNIELEPELELEDWMVDSKYFN